MIADSTVSDGNYIAAKLFTAMQKRGEEFWLNDSFIAGIFLDPRFKFNERSEELTLARRDKAIVSVARIIEKDNQLSFFPWCCQYLNF